MARRLLLAALLLASCSPIEEPARTGLPAPDGSFATRSLSFAPSADAYVLQGSPNSNFGSATTLRVDGSPLERTLIRFDVTTAP